MLCCDLCEKKVEAVFSVAVQRLAGLVGPPIKRSLCEKCGQAILTALIPIAPDAANGGVGIYCKGGGGVGAFYKGGDK
jgi:hypothetical protein